MRISIRSLLAASVAYLFLPFCIFLFGWETIPLAILFSVTLFFVLWRSTEGVAGSMTVSRMTLFITAAALFVWTLLSGAGHRGLFDGDFYKHSAILSDLISFSWPVTYRLKEGGAFVRLVYYFAYYLPSALIGKAWGWKAANIALFLYTYIGISIAILWLQSVFEEKKQAWAALLFPFFSGLDIVGRLIMGRKVVNDSDWEWWGRNWQYSGNTTLLFYVPQHVLAAWICMGILLYMYLKNKKLPLQELLFVGTILWSPFVFIGIAPFYLYFFIKRKFRPDSVSMLLSLYVFFIEIMFFLGNLTLSVSETNAGGWLWQIEKLFGSMALIRLALFYIVEFGLFAFLLYKAKKTSPVFNLSIVLLLLIPWYKMGLMNDFCMRASIPSLYVVAIYFLRYLLAAKKGVVLTVFAWTIFVIGSMYPLVLMGNGIVHFSFGPPRYSLATLDQPKFRMQYLGAADAPFFKLFRHDVTREKIGSLSIRK